MADFSQNKKIKITRQSDVSHAENLMTCEIKQTPEESNKSKFKLNPDAKEFVPIDKTDKKLDKVSDDSKEESPKASDGYFSYFSRMLY
jgi:hypothetical protein